MSLRRYAVDNHIPGCLPDRDTPSPLFRTPEEAIEALIMDLSEVDPDHLPGGQPRLDNALYHAKKISSAVVEEMHIGEEVHITLNDRNYYIQAVLISAEQAAAEESHYGTAEDLAAFLSGKGTTPVIVQVAKGGVWLGNGMVFDVQKVYGTDGKMRHVKLDVHLPVEKNPFQVGDIVRQKPDGDGKTKLPTETLGKVVKVHDEHTITVEWQANRYAPTRGFVDSFLPVRTKVRRVPENEIIIKSVN